MLDDMLMFFPEKTWFLHHSSAFTRQLKPIQVKLCFRWNWSNQNNHKQFQHFRCKTMKTIRKLLILLLLLLTGCTSHPDLVRQKGLGCATATIKMICNKTNQKACPHLPHRWTTINEFEKALSSIGSFKKNVYYNDDWEVAAGWTGNHFVMITRKNERTLVIDPLGYTANMEDYTFWSLWGLDNKRPDIKGAAKPTVASR